MLKRVFSSEQKTIGGATIIIASAVLLSRILGLIRDRLLAGAFGASLDLDIYFVAFRIPDLIYSIIFAGGVMVSLLPIFSEYYNKGKKDGWETINNVVNFFIITFSLFALLFFIFTPQLICMLAPGFDCAAQATAVALTRLIFLSTFFFGLSSVFSTVLNYFNRFFAYSVSPILYNLGIIFGIIFLVPYFGVFGAGIGVVIGSFMHFLIAFLVSKSCGFKYKPVFSFKQKSVREFFALLVPRTIAASASQINFLVITFIASTISAGAISVFNLSNNLRYLPVGIVGVSFATALFPHLSKLWVDNNKEEFFKKFTRVFNQIMFIAFPIGLLLFLLRDSIVEIILQTGQFDESAVAITSAALGLYVISTFAQCLAPVILRAFFSLKDTRTPTLISIFFLIVSVLLSFWFVDVFSGENTVSLFFSNLLGVSGEGFPVLGLVLAFNIGMLLDFLISMLFLYRKVGDFGIKAVFNSFSRVLCSSFLMVLGCVFVQSIIGGSSSIVEFLLVSGTAVLIYLCSSLLLKSPEIKELERVKI